MCVPAYTCHLYVVVGAGICLKCTVYYKLLFCDVKPTSSCAAAFTLAVCVQVKYHVMHKGYKIGLVYCTNVNAYGTWRFSAQCFGSADARS